MTDERHTPKGVPPLTLIRDPSVPWGFTAAGVACVVMLAVVFGWPLITDPYPPAKKTEKHMKTSTLPLTNANTEYPFTLSQTCVHFRIQARTAHDVRISTTAGVVATSANPFWTIKSGTVLPSRDIDRMLKPGSPLTIYLASGNAGTVVEIVEFF